jgi:hypothetical protein
VNVNRDGSHRNQEESALKQRRYTQKQGENEVKLRQNTQEARREGTQIETEYLENRKKMNGNWKQEKQQCTGSRMKKHI